MPDHDRHEVLLHLLHRIERKLDVLLAATAQPETINALTAELAASEKKLTEALKAHAPTMPPAE